MRRQYSAPPPQCQPKLRFSALQPCPAQRATHRICAMEPCPEQSPAASRAGPAVLEQIPATSVESFAGTLHGSIQASPADSTNGDAASGRSEGPQQAAASTQQAALAASDDSNEDNHSEADADEQQDDQEVLAAIMAQLQDLHVAEAAAASQPSPTLTAAHELLPSFDLAGVAALISSGKARRIICMVGAGISVSCGIPDFRSPGTGLYSQLERFNLPRPEAVFSMDFFRAQPEPFFMLAKELFPGKYMPSPTHFFLKLLHSQGLLLRCYTQNIDSLECQAGLPTGSVVAAHGNFDGAHCIDCRKPHSTSHVEEAVSEGRVCYCTSCGGLVKPDIVFFGENLPARFFTQQSADFPACDLLLVMGTSLVVQPFAGLIDRVLPTTPRVLLNRERVGESHEAGLIERLLGLSSGGRSRGFDFRHAPGCRDVCVLGDADDSVRELANLLGWREQLEELIAAARRDVNSSKEELQAKSGGDGVADSSGMAHGTKSSDAVEDAEGGDAEAAHKAAAAAAAVGQVVGVHTAIQPQ